ncbi:MAG: four helix bundle protein, partial [Deltaproteobacteria bacterium]
MKPNPNIIKVKSYQFSLNIIGLYKKMVSQNEYILSKQLVRSGTSIGANVEEASAAQ